MIGRGLLARGLGRGSGLQKPLATAIIFGLAIGAPLVLTMLPTLVLVFTRAGRRVELESSVPV